MGERCCSALLEGNSVKSKHTRAELAAEFERLPGTALVDAEMVSAFSTMSVRMLEDLRWRRQGLPFTKIGRLVRYKKSDVLRFLESPDIYADLDAA